MLSRALDLLSLARNLRHYEETLAKPSGAGFNIFNILHVGHYEVRTHSPLLAELLSPEGSHGQGAVFLRCFLNRFNLQPFDAESAKIYKEYFIGAQTEEEGGRLDILIKAGGRDILIENKIYAGLQPNQLGRYRKFNKEGALMFLTLRGDPPDTPAAEIPDNLKCISYERDIINWLQDCRKEAVGAPSVRETITQYIQLIQALTQQNTSPRMNQELTNTILSNKETFLAYGDLVKAQRDVRSTITATLEGKLQTVADKVGLEVDHSQPIGDLSKAYNGFSLSSPLLQQLGVGICFEFGKGDYRDLYFGFYYLKKGVNSPAIKELQEAFKFRFGRVSPPTEIWAASAYWEERRDWNDETFAAIQFGAFADELRDVLQKLKDCIPSVSKG
jgi:hypothetical protein